MKELEFTKDNFDVLRVTLSEHLREIMPENKYREEILNLIHDVQSAASDCANQLLKERLGKCQVVRYGFNSTQIGDLECWYPETQKHFDRKKESHKAFLVGVSEVGK